LGIQKIYCFLLSIRCCFEWKQWTLFSFFLHSRHIFRLRKKPWSFQAIQNGDNCSKF
jgi:hypothetical protein